MTEKEQIKKLKAQVKHYREGEKLLRTWLIEKTEKVLDLQSELKALKESFDKVGAVYIEAAQKHSSAFAQMKAVVEAYMAFTKAKGFDDKEIMSEYGQHPDDEGNDGSDLYLKN